MQLSPKDRVVIRRFLREALKEAMAEEKNFINLMAKRANIKLEAPVLTAQEREDMRISNKRAGRTPGLRRGFGG